MKKRFGFKRTLAGILAVLTVAGYVPANVGGLLTGGTGIVASAADSGSNGGFNWTLDDDGNMTVTGNGELPERFISQNDNIKSLVFDENCQITTLKNYCIYWGNNITNIVINSTVPLSVEESAFWYKNGGGPSPISITINAPKVTIAGLRPFFAYGRQLNITVNTDELIVYNGTMSYLGQRNSNNSFAYPANSTVYIPAGYVFTASYMQEEYNEMVEYGMEDMFWQDYGSELTEGVDYTYNTEASSVALTPENASNVFGGAQTSSSHAYSTAASTSIDSATVNLASDNSVASLSIGNDTVTDLSGFDITYGTDDSHTATTVPTEAGTYYAYVTAKDSNTAYTGTAKSAAFTVSKALAVGETYNIGEKIKVNSDVYYVYDDELYHSTVISSGEYEVPTPGFIGTQIYFKSQLFGHDSYWGYHMGLDGRETVTGIRCVSGEGTYQHPYKFEPVIGEYNYTHIGAAGITMEGNTANVTEVRLFETVLRANEDYTVSYMMDDEPFDGIPTAYGEYTLVIKGIGDYGGVVKKDFSIDTPLVFWLKSITEPYSPGFASQAAQEQLAAAGQSGTLSADLRGFTADGSTSDERKFAAGEYGDEFRNKLMQWAMSNQRYVTTEAEYQAYLESLKTDISGSDNQTDSAAATFEFNTANVTAVKLGNTTLTADDYTLTYKKGSEILASAPTAVGNYTLIITGKGNYRGTVEQPFSILDEIGAFNANPAANPTLTLTRDYSGEIYITRADGTIDFDGNAIGSNLFLQNNDSSKTLTLKNGIVHGNIDGAPGFGTYFAGKVVLENMTVDGIVWADGHEVEICSGSYHGVSKSQGSEVISISGGTFDNKPSDEWAAEGYAFAQNTEGKWICDTIDNCNAIVAARVVSLIEDIPTTVTLSCQNAISEARYAYDALTDAQKKKISAEDLAKLTAAEQVIEPLYYNTNDFEGNINETAELSVYTQSGVSFQWQYLDGTEWKNCDCETAQSATLSFTLKGADDGAQYRCAVSKNGYTAFCNPITVKVIAEITEQPQDYFGIIGETAEFTVAASGTNMTYQWQFLSTYGWKDSGMTGAKTAKLSVPITEARDGQQYRCIVKYSDDFSKTSNPAKIIVPGEKAAITSQPTTQKIEIGQIAKFTVAGAGENLKYQWLFKSANGWVDSGMTGANTATLSVPVTAARDGQEYCCVVTAENGTTATSETVKIIAGVKLTEQPKDFKGIIGTDAKFTVSADGNNLKYQWQFLSSTGWKDSGMEGAKTATLSVPITAARDGQQYKCVVTSANGTTATSEIGKIIAGVKITAQPKDFKGIIGTDAKFTVLADGKNLSYQWKFNDNGVWKNSGMTGAKSATISIPITAERDGQQYKCVITAENGTTVESDIVKMIMGAKITEQPKDYTGIIGETAKFTVSADGNNLSYQWQFLSSTGWKNSGMTGAKTATISIPITAARDGQQYRCVITSSNGASVTTNTLKLTSGVKITAQPKDCAGKINETAKFTVSADGNNLKYQWQFLSSTGWKDSGMEGAKTATLSVPITAARDGQQYKCVVTSANGTTATSNSAKLTVTK